MGRDSVVLVTGAGGQVGQALRRELPNGRFLNHSQFDITNRSQIPAALSNSSAVIHLAAMTDVDRCEEQPEMASAINGDATGTLSDAAAQLNIPVIYLSTDYVFDGNKLTAYDEGDAPSPINAYGRSKLEGEHHVAKHRDNLIVRTSWVFGEGRNFIRSILNAADRRQSLTVVDDQSGRPTWAGDLAAALSTAVGSHLTGLIHYSGSGPICTWADLAEKALQLAALDVPVDRVDSRDYAISTGRIVAPRPTNSALLLDKAEKIGLPLRDWREALRIYIEGSS